MSTTNVVRTVSAGRLQTSTYTKLPAGKLRNSTLNEKLDIQKDAELVEGETASCNYVAIGNGGHSFTIAANGRPKWEAIKHLPRHSGLYNQLPFVLRRIDNDLPASQRSRYRLRRIEEHNGVNYAAYYLRVLDKTYSVLNTELRTVVDGNTTSVPFEYTLADLNPMPPALTAGSSVTTAGEYVATTAKIPFVMSANDIAEFVRAVEIITGDAGFAIISEVATVSGVDRAVQGNFNGNVQGYTEAICASIDSFISTAFVAEYFADGLTINLDIGNVEPLLTTVTID